MNPRIPPHNAVIGAPKLGCTDAILLEIVGGCRLLESQSAQATASNSTVVEAVAAVPAKRMSCVLVKLNAK